MMPFPTLIMVIKLRKIDPSYYMTKCWRSANMPHKCSSNVQKTSEGTATFQKKQQDKNIEKLKESHTKKGAF